MSYFVFVDNSNVWIEGKYASAVKKGWVPNVAVAHSSHILDNAWKMDFGKLLNCITCGGTNHIKEANIFGSKPTENDTLWNAMERAGFKVNNPHRNASNKEKKVDTGTVTAIDRALFKQAKPGDTFILAMGDTDYVPIVQNIKGEGFDVAVAFWNNVSGELAAEVTKFIDLTPHIDEITYTGE